MPTDPDAADGWNRFADGGRAVLVGAAVIAPLWRKDFRTSLSGFSAIIATYAASKTIKTFWREPRPNGQNKKSFPSEHAGDCFAAATVLDQQWRNSVGPLAIGIATAVSIARVLSGKHHVVDVVAGVALGVIAGEIAADYRV